MEFPKIFSKKPKENTYKEDRNQRESLGGNEKEEQTPEEENQSLPEKAENDHVEYVRSLRAEFLSNRKNSTREKRGKLDNKLGELIKNLEDSLVEFGKLSDQDKEEIKKEVGWMGKSGWEEPNDWEESIATELRAAVKSASDEEFEPSKKPILTAILKIHSYLQNNSK